MKKFYGVVTPLSTPMCADENVDYDSLESLCHFLIEKGINGLYPNGTTGEVIYLTADERKKILEHVVKAAAGRAVVFSMVGAATTAEMRLSSQVCSENRENAAPVFFTKVSSMMWGRKGTEPSGSMLARTKNFTAWSSRTRATAMTA